MSLPGRRFLATLGALWLIGVAALNAVAGALPDSTWVALKPLPGQGKSAVFALAVDPNNDQNVVAANSEGTLLRTTNGGGSWTAVHTGKVTVNAVTFSPVTTGLVLAGTRGSGALISRDSGATWSAPSGLEGRNVRVFAFALNVMAAGTDHGVYTSTDGAEWTQTSLSNRSISALAVLAVHDPVRLVAGTDAQTSGTLPLFASADGGATWKQLNPSITGTMTVRLATGPLPAGSAIRPLLAGTNTGLFLSTDNGASFNPLSGGGLLPTTDYTQATFASSHFDRFYTASDGGGSGSGGLWRSNDQGQTFATLQPPQASVTALAVSSGENPTLYVAMFQPATHTPALWAYHDTGGTPVGPPQTPALSGASPARPPDQSTVSQIFSSPELPYIGLGLGALAVVLTAVVAHLRGRTR